MADALLVKSAQAERDRRAVRYAAKIRDGADPEPLCLDYQCWVAIAEWLETGRFLSFAGGAEPERDDAPLVRWPELEAAALAAVRGVERKLAAEAWFDGCPPTALSERRNALVRIHRALQLQRERIDAINAGFRERREKETTA